ncbi:MAG: RHS repeat-associated core domain-containing protein [Candidatus Caccosoma sp.]|nr:RHS repeat-associated core domain-containing protein [Candidatus Caccosoma sp.]
MTGLILEIYNSGEVIIARYVYDAFGNHKVYDGSYNANTNDLFIININPFRHKSYYYGKETELFLVTSRYYDPKINRFISTDDISYLDPQSINGPNLYEYYGNDLVNKCDPSGDFAISTFLTGLAVTSLISWGLSKIFGAQITGGIGSVTGGATAISTGISLCAFGPWGIVAGIALMAVGGLTIAFGANEIVDGATGTNYIQNWTGWSDEVYNGVYIGLNVASAVGSIAGNIGMRIASNHILKGIVNNPESVQQYRLWQLKTYGKYTTQYVPGTLRRGEHIGQGYTLTHVKGATKGYIQWHPGSRHHYNGLPYWKVTSSLGGTWRGLYLF